MPATRLQRKPCAKRHSNTMESQIFVDFWQHSPPMLPRVRLSGKTYLLGRRLPVNSHRAGGRRNRPHPVTRHRNTGRCSEFIAHFLCGLHDPLWLCRAHYVLARISSKCRCAEYEREHDTRAPNRRTAQATKPVFHSHAVIVVPFRILGKLIYRLFETKKRHFQHCESIPPQDILGAAGGGLSHRGHRLPVWVHRHIQAEAAQHDERTRPICSHRTYPP
jgi:hypothetical protein